MDILDNLSLTEFISIDYKNLLNNGKNNGKNELKNLNIFIGPNGSGKSNYISALSFLKNCVSSSLEERDTSTQFENAIFQLGGSNILNKSIKIPSTVIFEYRFERTKEIPFRLVFHLQLDVTEKGQRVSIKNESLLAGEDKNNSDNHMYSFFYRTHEPNRNEGFVSIWDDENQRNSHLQNIKNVPTNSLSLTILHELLENSKYSPQQTPIYKVRRLFIEYLQRWSFYNSNNMDLHKIRTSEPKLGLNDIYLSPSGHNLALVIHNLIQKNIDFEDNLNIAMKSIIPITKRIRPVSTGLLNLNIEWYFDGSNEQFYLPEMSDGTVRMLCWATILLSPHLPTLLIIEEPEIGIHSAWMSVLAEWIKSASQRTQVIISTHSTDLLDQFTDNYENVSIFSYERDNKFSIKRLSKELLKDRFEEGWQLGDLYRVGDPSVGGWPW
jgi:predicted ATPase